MTTPVCFVDTETTSLQHDRNIWEVAVIRRDDYYGTKELLLQVHDVDLTNANLKSLQIGRFYERHWASRSYPPSCFKNDCRSESEVAHAVEHMLRGAHIVGAVPNFDTEALDAMFRRHRIISTWHYHLIDVENLAVGYIKGLQKAGGLHKDYDTNPPWTSQELGEVLGVEPETTLERHTALGDARWAMRMYDKVMGD